MADRGIIFSSPMVRALLGDRKTQPRRLIGQRNEASRLLLGEGWTDNPWVVALTFEVRKGNIDAVL